MNSAFSRRYRGGSNTSLPGSYRACPVRVCEISGSLLSVGWLPSPWPDASNSVDRDVGDVAGLGSPWRWELDPRPKVGVGEPLKKGGSATCRDTSCPVDDEVLNEPAFVMARRFEGQGNPRVVADVADLASLGQMPSYDLVTVEADPNY